MSSKPTYEIRIGKNAPCELWSVVKAHSFGEIRDIANYVCEGTYTYCQQIKEKLEKEGAH